MKADFEKGTKVCSKCRKELLLVVLISVKAGAMD